MRAKKIAPKSPLRRGRQTRQVKARQARRLGPWSDLPDDFGFSCEERYSAALMRYLNSRIQSCYFTPIIWVFTPKNRETERVTLATVMLWRSRCSETESFQCGNGFPLKIGLAMIRNVLGDLIKLAHYTDEAFHAVAVFVHRGCERTDRCGLVVARVGRCALQAGDRAAHRLDNHELLFEQHARRGAVEVNGWFGDQILAFSARAPNRQACRLALARR
jgi:hypothetical protein